MIDKEAEIDGLYATPLDQFTAARNDLAARLEQEGDKEEAMRIKRLKKPSISAWAVNQLVRVREVDIARLLKAGEALEEAQRAVLTGKPADFEKVRKEEGEAVRALRKAVIEVLPGASAAVLDRIAQTLRAASTADGRARLKEGRLTEDLEPAGFEAFASLPAMAPPAKGAKAANKQPNRKRALLVEKQKEGRDKVKEAAAEAREMEKEARATEAAARKAALAAEAARKRAELAQAELEKIEGELAKLS
ncbi:MAG TPA: hypothetical protein VJQ57_09075 [Acidimicrobiia bacterium]|nr:hypothetical protein [Acidimicrobiia bacterium]